MEEVIDSLNRERSLLESIAQLKEIFNSLKSATTVSSDMEILDKAVNSISKILDENRDMPHKNIGEKINKFNYEKYLHCENELDDILNNIENIKKEDFCSDKTSANRIGIEFYKLKFEAVKDTIPSLKKDIMHKISIYEKGQEANKRAIKAV